MSYCVEKGIPHDIFLSWPAESRAKHIAYLLEQGSVCQLCGTAPWEWEENKFAYTPVEHYCHGCYLKHVASEEAGTMPGTTINLAPVTPQLRAKEQLAAERRAKALAEQELEAEEE